MMPAALRLFVSNIRLRLDERAARRADRHDRHIVDLISAAWIFGRRPAPRAAGPHPRRVS